MLVSVYHFKVDHEHENGYLNDSDELASSIVPGAEAKLVKTPVTQPITEFVYFD